MARPLRLSADGSHMISSLYDKDRPGRPLCTDAASEQHILAAAQLPECLTAADIAANVEQAYGKRFSNSTVRRILKKNGLKHLSPRVVPQLTAQHKADRVQFAKICLRREVVSWRRTLVTDSKYFQTEPKGRPAARWCTPATRGSVARVSHPISVHVYMGISYWGVTKLKFVTGTHKQGSQYINPKTMRPYTGVCGQEYSDVVTQCFKPEGDRLFQQSSKWAGNWQLQQDNARVHTTPQNLALIESIVPGGLFPKWPAHSPDLSPIENLWAWMDRQLHKQGKCSGVEELKTRLQAIWESIRPEQLHALFDSMDDRMKRVGSLNGNHIGY